MCLLSVSRHTLGCAFKAGWPVQWIPTLRRPHTHTHLHTYTPAHCCTTRTSLMQNHIHIAHSASHTHNRALLQLLIRTRTFILFYPLSRAGLTRARTHTRAPARAACVRGFFGSNRTLAFACLIKHARGLLFSRVSRHVCVAVAVAVDAGVSDTKYPHMCPSCRACPCPC